MKHDKENIIIVGAGISGLTSALLLSKQGHKISVYDKRTAFDQAADGRSINFTISGRGLAVLEQLGLKESVLAHSATLLGRELHLKNAKTVRYKYGTKKSQVLLSIRRSDLINILLKEVNCESNISFNAGFELIDLDPSSLTCHFLHSDNQKMIVENADYLIGADGVFSNVRNFMLKKQIASYQQTVFDWGYKEYQFDHEDAKKLALSTNHMHMWPKSDALMCAIPNRDNTFSVIFTAPLKSDSGKLNNFDELVKHHFQNIIKDTPSFLKYSGRNLHNYIISIQLDKWHFDDKIVLVGDASHATYPFYGQGMNSALEDVVFLNRYINDKSLSRREAFLAYEKTRKADANVLHQLSEAHLQQMTKAMISPFRQACDILDYQLATFLSHKWIYEYEMVAHSTVRYADISDMVKKQNKKKRKSGFYLIASILGLIIQFRKLIRV